MAGVGGGKEMRVNLQQANIPFITTRYVREIDVIGIGSVRRQQMLKLPGASRRGDGVQGLSSLYLLFASYCMHRGAV